MGGPEVRRAGGSVAAGGLFGREPESGDPGAVAGHRGRGWAAGGAADAAGGRGGPGGGPGAAGGWARGGVGGGGPPGGRVVKIEGPGPGGGLLELPGLPPLPPYITRHDAPK